MLFEMRNEKTNSEKGSWRKRTNPGSTRTVHIGQSTGHYKKKCCTACVPLVFENLQNSQRHEIQAPLLIVSAQLINQRKISFRAMPKFSNFIVYRVEKEKKKSL